MLSAGCGCGLFYLYLKANHMTKNDLIKTLFAHLESGESFVITLNNNKKTLTDADLSMEFLSKYINLIRMEGQDGVSETVLTFAVQKYLLDAIPLLVELHPDLDLNARNSWGETAIDLAERNSQNDNPRINGHAIDAMESEAKWARVIALLKASPASTDNAAEVERQMKTAREIMQRRHALLSELAK